jgi:hypothetical protein
MLRQQHRVKAAGLARIGQTDPLLIDATDPHRPNVMLARSAACAPEVDGVVYLTNLTKQCRPGAFIKARYTGVRGYDMEAEPFKRGA